MAQVPVVDGPQISESSAPTPLQELQAPASAFGAAVGGQILGDVGAAAKQTSDLEAQHALAFQAINNKQAADEASQKFLYAGDSAREEFQKNNPGMAAYNNLPQFYKDLEQTRSGFSDNLSPLAKVEYDTATRRYAGGIASVAVGYAQSERKASVVGTATSKVALAQASMAAHPDDPAVQAAGMADIGDGAHTLATVHGWGDDQVKDYLQNTVGQVYAGQIRNAIASGDIPKAEKLLSDHSDQMPEKDLTQVMGALRVGQNAFIVNSEVMAARGVSPAPEVGTNVTSQPWDKGLAQFKADPAGTIGGLIGAPVTITSGARTPAANAAAGGSPTSEHLSGNAWDFVPSTGNLTANANRLAGALHTQGIPFDQIEIDPTNGHIHVGFGAKNRNEIVDQNGSVIQSATPASAKGIASPSLVIQPGVDPEAYAAKADVSIENYVDTKYANNPTLGAQVAAGLRAEANRQAQTQRASQEGTFNKLLLAAQDNNIQDPAGLATAYPGAAEDISSLPAKYRTPLLQTTNQNATRITPAREDNTETLIGMMKTDPETFVHTDLSQVDLDRATRIRLMGEQATIRGNQQKVQASQDSFLKQTMGGNEVNAALSGLGITKKDNPQQYFQFAGALSAEVEKIETATGKPPSSTDIHNIVMRVTAKVGGGWLGGGTPAFQVPQDKHDALVKSFQKARLNPTESDIASAYWSQTHGR